MLKIIFLVFVLSSVHTSNCLVPQGPLSQNIQPLPKIELLPLPRAIPIEIEKVPGQEGEAGKRDLENNYKPSRGSSVTAPHLLSGQKGGIMPPPGPPTTAPPLSPLPPIPNPSNTYPSAGNMDFIKKLLSYSQEGETHFYFIINAANVSKLKIINFRDANKNSSIVDKFLMD